MARTQAADYEAQRAAILDCAAEAFAERGYAACSMSDIAVKSGASKARLYHYYESKEAMLFDLLDRHTQRLVDIALEVRDRARRDKLAPKEELRNMIGAFLDAYQTSRTRHIALLNDVKFLQQKEQDKNPHPRAAIDGGRVYRGPEACVPQAGAAGQRPRRHHDADGLDELDLYLALASAVP